MEIVHHKRISNKDIIDLPNTWIKIMLNILAFHFINIKYARRNSSVFCSHLF